MTTIAKAYKYIKKKGCLNNLQHQTQKNNHMFHRPMIWFFSWKLPWMEGRFSRWSGIIVFLGNYFVLKEGYPTHLFFLETALDGRKVFPLICFSWKLPWMEGRFSHAHFLFNPGPTQPWPKSWKDWHCSHFHQTLSETLWKTALKDSSNHVRIILPWKNLWHSFTIPRNCMTINPFKSIHLFTTLIITKHLSYSKPWMKPFVLWRSQWKNLGKRSQKMTIIKKAFWEKQSTSDMAAVDGRKTNVCLESWILENSVTYKGKQ